MPVRLIAIQSAVAIDLSKIPGEHHLGICPGSSNDCLDLVRRQILSFINHHEGFVIRFSTDIIQRLNG